MKNLVLFMFALSATAYAIPGAPTVRTLSCRSLNHRLGVDYSLKVTTQALAPQYDVRGISVVTQVVSPNSQPNETALSQVRQTVHSATFAGDHVRVTLDKASFTANVYLDSRLEYVCAEQAD